MTMQSSLTAQQKREIIRLRSMGQQWKVIARTLDCTVDAARHVWRLLKTNYVEKNRRNARAANARRRLRVAARVAAERQEIAKRALRAEIDACLDERMTAPIFRIRADEWPARPLA